VLNNFLAHQCDMTTKNTYRHCKYRSVGNTQSRTRRSVADVLTKNLLTAYIERYICTVELLSRAAMPGYNFHLLQSN
jgi:hypothetical protein